MSAFFIYLFIFCSLKIRRDLFWYCLDLSDIPSALIGNLLRSHSCDKEERKETTQALFCFKSMCYQDHRLWRSQSVVSSSKFWQQTSDNPDPDPLRKFSFQTFQFQEIFTFKSLDDMQVQSVFSAFIRSIT